MDTRYNKWLEINHKDVQKRLFNDIDSPGVQDLDLDLGLDTTIDDSSSLSLEEEVKAYTENIPSSSQCSDQGSPLVPVEVVPSTLKEFLKLPPPPSQVCKPKTLPKARVLTSE